MNVTNGLLCLILAALLALGYRGDDDSACINVVVFVLAVLAAAVFFIVALAQAGFFGWVFGLVAALAG